MSALVLAEPAHAGAADPHGARRAAMRWWRPLAGAAVAASVAAVSILWLRAQAPGSVLTAQVLPGSGSAPVTVVPRADQGDPGAGASYVVPRAPATRAVVVPSTELANYVVAHSVYSSPVARRNLLSAFMTSESVPAGEPVAAEEPQVDVQSPIR